MGKLFDAIDDRLRAFIEAQPVFFVATAPSGDDGHVNVSPKGGAGMFRVTGPHGFAYADMIGSGIETVAHLRDNGRICVMFAAFEGPPKIVRLHGTGSHTQLGEPGFDALVEPFGFDALRLQAVRAVVSVDVTRISDSCGFAVPFMRYEGERDQLLRYQDTRLRKDGPEAAWQHRLRRNASSIDGLPGLEPQVPARS